MKKFTINQWLTVLLPAIIMIVVTAFCTHQMDGDQNLTWKNIFIVFIFLIFPIIYAIQGILAVINKVNVLLAFMVSTLGYIFLMFTFLNFSAVGYIFIYLLSGFIGYYIMKVFIWGFNFKRK
ncbi:MULTISPECIES: hypothetical protein [Bacillus]|uniref:hypothetical protein n=1 Tax=Bacillus TaxID=1386 RepID=UPI00036B2F37|nr:MULTISPECIES: hypothetical protein [Bacillus]